MTDPPEDEGTPPSITRPEDEGLHVIRRDEPEPRLLYSAVSKTEAQTRQTERPPELEISERPTLFTLGRVGLIAGILLFIVLVVVGLSYILEQLHKQVGPHARTNAITPSITATAAPSPIPWVTTEMLHVTAISLGDVHLAVVNGKRMAEGDSLDLKMPAGIVTLRVTSIEDGVVHFEYDGKTIDAKLTASSGAAKSP